VTVIDIDRTLRTAVAGQLRIPPDDLTGETPLETLGLNDDETALGVIEAVEDLLEVRFPDDFLDGLATYGDLSSAVRIAVGV
jgi:acyl carrier protein